MRRRNHQLVRVERKGLHVIRIVVNGTRKLNLYSLSLGMPLALAMFGDFPTSVTAVAAVSYMNSMAYLYPVNI